MNEQAPPAPNQGGAEAGAEGEFDCLVEAFLDGTITESERAVLAAAVLDDAGKRTTFLEQARWTLRLDAHLRHQKGDQQGLWRRIAHVLEQHSPTQELRTAKAIQEQLLSRQTESAIAEMAVNPGKAETVFAEPLAPLPPSRPARVERGEPSTEQVLKRAGKPSTDQHRKRTTKEPGTDQQRRRAAAAAAPRGEPTVRFPFVPALLAIAVAAGVAVAVWFTRPPPPPPAPPALAYVHIARGTGLLEHANATRTVTGDQPLYADDRIRLDDRGAATIAYPGEISELSLGAGSDLGLGDGPGGKTLQLERGALIAEIAKQPAGKPLTIATPQGVATVVGTGFTLTVKSETTTLIVRDGSVHLTRPDGKDGIDVAKGSIAVVSEGQPLAAAPATPVAAIVVGDPDLPWRDLFNGKDLIGWQIDRGAWKIENGSVIGEGAGERARIESEHQFVDLELTCKLRLTGAKFAEVQLRSYNHFFQLTWDQPGTWKEFKLTVRGQKMQATSDGKPVAAEAGFGDPTMLKGPLAFYAMRGGKLEIKDAKFRELYPE